MFSCISLIWSSLFEHCLLEPCLREDPGHYNRVSSCDNKCPIYESPQRPGVLSISARGAHTFKYYLFHLPIKVVCLLQLTPDSEV